MKKQEIRENRENRENRELNTHYKSEGCIYSENQHHCIMDRIK